MVSGATDDARVTHSVETQPEQRAQLQARLATTSRASSDVSPHNVGNVSNDDQLGQVCAWLHSFGNNGGRSGTVSTASEYTSQHRQRCPDAGGGTCVTISEFPRSRSADIRAPVDAIAPRRGRDTSTPSTLPTCCQSSHAGVPAGIGCATQSVDRR